MLNHSSMDHKCDKTDGRMDGHIANSSSAHAKNEYKYDEIVN